MIRLPKPEHVEFARLCAQVYSGIPGAEQVTVDNFTAYVADRVIVFQGTNDIRDWLANIQIGLVQYSPYARGLVHKGFRDAWLKMHRKVADVAIGQDVTLIGHSLGGALATLAAASFSSFGGWKVNEVVTFGCPRVGDADFADWYTANLGKKTTRYVYASDPVTAIPPYLRGYRHVRPPVWFNGEHWQDGVDLLTYAWRLLELLRVRKPIWQDHDVANYVKAMERSLP